MHRSPSALSMAMLSEDVRDLFKKEGILGTDEFKARKAVILEEGGKHGSCMGRVNGLFMCCAVVRKYVLCMCCSCVYGCCVCVVNYMHGLWVAPLCPCTRRAVPGTPPGQGNRALRGPAMGPAAHTAAAARQRCGPPRQPRLQAAPAVPALGRRTLRLELAARGASAAYRVDATFYAEDEDEDEEDWPGAGGRLQAPTRGQYTLGVGAAVAASHDPSTHGLPERRSGRGARARLVRVLGEHLQVLTDKFTAHSTTGTPAGPRGEGEPGSILRRSRYTGLARGPHGAAGTPDWPAGGGGEGRAGQRGAPPYGSAGTPDWREGPYGTAGTPDWLEGGGGGRRNCRRHEGSGADRRLGPGGGGAVRMRMRRTGPEPADAYGHPTGGTYTLGVGAAVAASHDPSTHGLPKRRSDRGARARLVRV